uniref:Uncharacterized protein n=1 Tax=Plectus sambesii TaxID=2011161 RepID=A0A914UL63_9BILA
MDDGGAANAGSGEDRDRRWSGRLSQSSLDRQREREREEENRFRGSGATARAASSSVVGPPAANRWANGPGAVSSVAVGRHRRSTVAGKGGVCVCDEKRATRAPTLPSR